MDNSLSQLGLMGKTAGNLNMKRKMRGKEETGFELHGRGVELGSGEREIYGGQM